MYRDCRGFRLLRKRAEQMPWFMITVRDCRGFRLPRKRAVQILPVIASNRVMIYRIIILCREQPCEKWVVPEAVQATERMAAVAT